MLDSKTSLRSETSSSIGTVTVRCCIATRRVGYRRCLESIEDHPDPYQLKDCVEMPVSRPNACWNSF